jgi:hypothetical protein
LRRSPVVVSESGKEGDDVVQDSSDQSVEGTPEPPEKYRLPNMFSSLANVISVFLNPIP